MAVGPLLGQGNNSGSINVFGGVRAGITYSGRITSATLVVVPRVMDHPRELAIVHRASGSSRWVPSGIWREAGVSQGISRGSVGPVGQLRRGVSYHAVVHQVLLPGEDSSGTMGGLHPDRGPAQAGFSVEAIAGVDQVAGGLVHGTVGQLRYNRDSAS